MDQYHIAIFSITQLILWNKNIGIHFRICSRNESKVLLNINYSNEVSFLTLYNLNYFTFRSSPLSSLVNIYPNGITIQSMIQVLSRNKNVIFKFRADKISSFPSRHIYSPLVVILA